MDKPRYVIRYNHPNQKMYYFKPGVRKNVSGWLETLPTHAEAYSFDEAVRLLGSIGESDHPDDVKEFADNTGIYRLVSDVEVRVNLLTEPELLRLPFTRFEVTEALILNDRYDWGLVNYFVDPQWENDSFYTGYECLHREYRKVLEYLRGDKFHAYTDNGERLVMAFWIRQALHILAYEKKHGRLPR